MSKNIVIQEGGTNYQFTAKKLKTDKIGGGSVLWVPEEETILKKLRVTEEGTYKASDEGYYGYSEVVVDVTGSGSLKTKRITHNGTYKAEDDGLMGYSKVKVNVRGGNGSADSSGRPRTTFDSDGNVEDAPGGIGSAVFGTDPNTGEWVTVGVDSNGNLVSTPIPAGIEIVTPPTKTSYADGESIDYSGIVVNLKTRSGNTFTNATYPNGHIPMQELVFPISTASGAGGGGGQQSIDIKVGTDYWRTYTIDGPGAISAMKQPSGYVSPISVSKTYDGAKITVIDHKASDWNTVLNPTQIIIDGVEYYAYWGYGFQNGEPYYAEPSSFEEAVRLLLPVPEPGSSQIPVRWVSPYDGNTYEDSFEISVTGGSSGSGSGSTDGGGYSDDSGGSSSGGGGGF